MMIIDSTLAALYNLQFTAFQLAVIMMANSVSCDNWEALLKYIGVIYNILARCAPSECPLVIG